MGKITIQGTLIAKRNTAENWTAANPTLSQGEFGVELDTLKFKIGDGVTAWNDLAYAHATPAAACNIVLAGDVAGTGSFDGSQDVEIAVKLTEVLDAEVSENFVKFTVGKDGRITAATVYSATEYLAALGIVLGTAAGNVPVLDSDGKLNTSVIPALAISEPYTVKSEEEMLALDCQRGDVAIRTDVTKTYILAGDDPSDIDNWVQFLSPTGDVVSVNGKVGIIELSTDDVEEGTKNLYYTDARVNAAIEAFFTDNEVIFDGNGAA